MRRSAAALVVVATRGAAEQVLGGPDEVLGFGHPLVAAVLGGRALFVQGDLEPGGAAFAAPGGTLRAVAALPLDTGFE